ncbi:hypothetical protein IY145_17850 [Methylosinus sp. H3A]|uniref:hypothetical protein n=1 Tax=Methylosinus sp. H3A TaxID=2785786 RepID=UPI0018C1F41F|nr:hypothetical protein [Methylosinus sp. H3A]MBG0811222.1 hypothetical protein [Methylosinus sp. H3A]
MKTLRRALGAALALSSTSALAGDEPPLNPAVTQLTIDETICVSGWTKTQRPPQSTTGPIKRALFRGDGLPDEAFESAILDHVIPLELGGFLDDARNFQLEEAEEAREKDRTEHCLRRAVCAGLVTLAEAQAAIWRDWRSAAALCGDRRRSARVAE